MQKSPKKFCQFGKRLYLCTRFRKGTAVAPLHEAGPGVLKEEIFDRLLTNNKAV